MSDNLINFFIEVKTLINQELYKHCYLVDNILHNENRVCKANMKNILLTVISLLGLISCQSIKKQQHNQVIESENIELQNISDSQQLVNSASIIETMTLCYADPVCKKEFDTQINSWMQERGLLPEDQEVITDEQVSSIQSSSGLPEDNKRIKKAHLSSNYMKNELIRGALNEWLTWKRPQLINTWQYFLFLKKEMQPAFEKYSLDEAFILAIMAQESGGKVHSRSRAGAGGLFQLMPATARRLGLSGKDGAYDLRFNPKKSAQAAAAYINEQLNLYDGDRAKVLAAYNSGENRFRRLNKQHKDKPLWDKNFYYDLPRETRHYVPVVLAAMLIFQDPQKFNVRLDKVNTDIITVNLAKPTSLSELSICLGQEQRSDGWFRILRNLNSGIKADNTIKAHVDLRIPRSLEGVFNSKCQNREFMKLAKSLHDADFRETQGYFRYKVKSGDVLGKIARKFSCTSRKEIARLNHLKAPRYLIRAGKYLKIPEC
jgi:membrane-bound lytic murein transglycosylase D